MTTRMPASVETIMSAWPGPAQKAFQQLRALILEIAGDDPKIGTLTETLKWREPAFLTDESGSGTTVRVAWKAKQPDHIGVFVSCNSSLMDHWRSIYGDVLDFDGNREIRLPLGGDYTGQALRHCIAMALTYHLK